jgi:hypothetical protein
VKRRDALGKLMGFCQTIVYPKEPRHAIVFDALRAKDQGSCQWI